MRRAIVDIIAATTELSSVIYILMEVRAGKESYFLEIHYSPSLCVDSVMTGKTPGDLKEVAGTVDAHMPHGWTRDELFTAAHYWAKGFDAGLSKGRELFGFRPIINPAFQQMRITPET